MGAFHVEFVFNQASGILASKAGVAITWHRLAGVASALPLPHSMEANLGAIIPSINISVRVRER